MFSFYFVSNKFFVLLQQVSVRCFTDKAMTILISFFFQKVIEIAEIMRMNDNHFRAHIKQMNSDLMFYIFYSNN